MSEAFPIANDRRASRAAVAPVLRGLGELSWRVPQGPLRFLVAGGLASLVNWLARFPLSIGLPLDLAVALAYAVGMAAGFGLYRSWVFPGSDLTLSSQVLRFVGVNLLGLAAVVASAHLFVGAIVATGWVSVGTAEGLGHGIAILFGAVVNYLGHRAVTFARSASLPGR